MDVLGHSQISVTLNTYTHVIPALVDEAAAAMDRALSGDEDETDHAGPNGAPQGQQGSGWGSTCRCRERGTHDVGVA